MCDGSIFSLHDIYVNDEDLVGIIFHNDLNVFGVEIGRPNTQGIFHDHFLRYVRSYFNLKKRFGGGES